MTTYSLKSLYEKFEEETLQIVNRFKTPLPQNGPYDITCAPAHRYCREMCLIRLQDDWARFCRQLIIWSAGRAPETMGGSHLQLVAGISKPSEVIPKLNSTRPKRNWERHWHDPIMCLEAARRLQAQNINAISAGLGMSPSPLDDLRKLRNFVAHRGQENTSQVRRVAHKLGFKATASAEQIVSTNIFPGQTVFERWVTQLHKMARAAAM